ncbi:MAG: potassium/proton antiporter [Rhodocyclales bacterium]|nr:potassium/proton antiporter [Rhodocyclales bacterium]
MQAANELLFVGALLFVAAVLVSAWAFRVGAPLLLVFLVVGMLAGEEGPGGIRFDDFRATYIVGNIALAVILFDGGLRTRVTSFALGFRPAMSLATLGVLVTAAITGAIAAWALGLSLLQGLLVGAIVGSTDAAAVFSLLRNQGIGLKQRVATVLEIESGSNDPMAIFLTVALVALLASGEAPSWQIGVFFVQQMGLGLVAGYAGGRLLAWGIDRIRLAEGLYPLLALAGGLFVFAATAYAGGSGFLAIYVAGIVLGNRPVHAVQDILSVHDGLAWLAQIVMFLVLGLLATPSELIAVAPAALLVAAGMIFVARPVAVWLSLLFYRAPAAEKLFISWVGLRGAVPVVLALFPLMAGLDQARLYFDVAFFVVLVSLVCQGWTITPLARRLKLELPPVFEARQRVALDIGGGKGFELVGYQVPEWSPLNGAGADELDLAPGERIVAAFRGDRPLEPPEAARFAGSDIVYLLARSGNVDAVSRRFAARPLPEPLLERRFFGDFALDPQARLADVCLAYGIQPPAELADLSLAEVIARRFKGIPVVGDRVTLAGIDLVVRQTDGKSIARVGLVLHPMPKNADRA